MDATTILTPEEQAALVRFASRNGRNWKSALRDAWMRASEPGILQALRNASYFGPSGLVRFKLPR